jgi:CheY-like chemotaxis protein
MLRQMAETGSLAPIVLLVAPAHDDRRIYAEYLLQHGYRTVEIGSTEEAWRSCSNADLIVTGINVAGSYDGIELVRRIRSDKATADKPVIVLTASVWEVDREAAREVGCDAFLPKPCVPDRLLDSIRRLLPIQAQ